MVLLICLDIPSVYAAGQPPGFKDIELGSDISKISQDKRFKCKRTDSPVAEQTCRLMGKYEEDIYGAPLLTLTLNYFSGRLSTIVVAFESIHFDAVKEGLEQDYGQPGKRMVEKYVTRRASLFRGYIYVWENKAFVIDAIEYFSASGNSAVVYKFDAYR